jgi:hypothetical protein
MSEETLRLRLQLQAATDADIAHRTAVHKARIAQLRAGQAVTARLAPALPSQAPLVMLAHGDASGSG